MPVIAMNADRAGGLHPSPAIQGSGATAAFHQAFAGPLASLPRPLCGEAGGDERCLTFRELADRNLMAEVLDGFARVYPGGDRRAVGSMWSKWFFGGVLPAITGLLLGQGRACASDDASVGVVLDGVGYTRRLWIREGGEIVVRATVVSGLEALVRDRLSPVVEALADASGASRNVFWSNAGNTLEYLIGEMARHPSITPSTLHDAYGFLDTRRLGDGERNPLFRPVRYRQVAGEGNPVERTRRACCIRYLLPEMSYCANCPLNCAARSGERDQRRAAGTTRREGVA